MLFLQVKLKRSSSLIAAVGAQIMKYLLLLCYKTVWTATILYYCYYIKPKGTDEPAFTRLQTYGAKDDLIVLIKTALAQFHLTVKRICTPVNKHCFTRLIPA